MQTIDLTTIEGLARAIEEMLELEAKKAQLDAEAAKLQAAIDNYRNSVIVEGFQLNGLQAFTYKDVDYRLDYKVFGSINPERQSEAFDILAANGYGEKIKTVLKADFPKGESVDDTLITYLKDLGADVDVKEGIHSSSLHSALKKLLEVKAIDPLTGPFNVKEQYRIK